MSPTEKTNPASENKASFNKSVFETLQIIYRPYYLSIFLLIISGFLGRIFLLGNANVIGYWVDTLCKDPKICKTPPEIFLNWSSGDFILLLSVLTAVGFLMTAAFRIGLSRVSAQAVSGFYDEVTLRTSRFPMSFFDKSPAGRIITRFSSDYGTVFRMFGGPLAEFLAIVFDIIAIIFLITLASPYYLVLVIFIGFLNWKIYLRNRDKLREARRQLSASRSPSIAHFAETTQGATTIRIYARTQDFLNRFLKLDKIFLKEKTNTTKKLISFSIQMSSLTGLMMLLTGVAAYYMTQNKLLSIGAIGVAFGFITLSGNTVQMFFEWLAQFEEALIGVERLDRYLRLPIEKGSRLPVTAQFQTGHPQHTLNAITKNFEPSLKNASIQFNNLWFRYSDSLPFVLKGIHLEIKAGEKIGIIGRTGSGKSSLIQALFHLYPITQGEIQIDQWNAQVDTTRPALINELDLDQFRTLMTFISQDPVIFKGTLRDNLSFLGDHQDPELIQSLDRVGLLEWFTSLPEGFDYQLEERGKNLSQGEKQLICMARCLLQKSPIVIMDEATSNVDPQSEEIMVKATQDFFKERTQIIIAHRLSTLQQCDRVVWLEDGLVRQIGSPEQIIPLFQQSHLT